MRERLRRIVRVLEVEDVMRRLEEAELARVNHQVQDVEATRRRLVEAGSGIPPFHGLFHNSQALRLRELAAEEGRLRAEAEARAEALIAAAIRHKKTERLSERLSAEWEALSERRAWDDSLDLLAGAAGRDASLPPAPAATAMSADRDARPARDSSEQGSKGVNRFDQSGPASA